MDNPVVLLVDDFPLLLGATASRLRHEGFDVIEATRAEEALDVLSRRDDVAIVIADCSMPGMEGPQLARLILERYPEVPIILTSGNPPDDLPEGVEFIKKPYRAAQLTKAIRSWFPAE